MFGGILRPTSLFILLLIWLGTPISAQAGCFDILFEERSFTACRANPATDDIRLWLNDENDTLLGTFSAVDRALEKKGLQLEFATNGGMYHPDRSPVGHFVENGIERRGVITSDGPGNFGLLPNGVLCLTNSTAAVWESRAFASARPECQFATQSGPLMVNDGKLHPRFLENGTSRYIRNGVGVDRGGNLLVAISNEPVNFHRFARMFRDVLDTPNALYLDGNVSRLFARDLGRSDAGFPMGPILGVTGPKD